MDWQFRIYKENTKELNWDYDPESRNIIVAQNNEQRLHNMFDTYEDAFTYQFMYNQDNLFEVILSDRKQKPYFDIDINDTCYNAKKYDRLIDAFVCSLSNKLDEVDEGVSILVFTSHREDKLSYHIVVDGIYLKSNEHNREFCSSVMTYELREYFDDLYKTLQQFRIYNCSKYGKDNRKIFNSNLSTLFIPKNFDETDRHYFIYTKSLITNTEECEYYPVKLSKKKVKYNESFKNVELNFISGRALKLFQEKHQDYDYNITNVREANENTIIELRTLRPYYCRSCKRTHDHENAFIYISPAKKVWFNCRRTKKKELVGSV